MQINDQLNFDIYFLSKDSLNNEFVLGIINILKEIISDEPHYNLLKNMLYKYKNYNSPWYFFGYTSRTYESFINNCKYFLENLLRFSKSCDNLRLFFTNDYYIYGYNGTYFCAKENEVHLKPFCRLSEVRKDLTFRVENFIRIFDNY